MDINQVLSELKDKFGDRIDVSKVTEVIKGVDLSKVSMTEIIEKVKGAGAFFGDLDGDGVQEGFFEELKGKFGSLFGKK